MKINLKRLMLILSALIFLNSAAHTETTESQVSSDTEHVKVKRALLASSLMPNIEGYKLTSVTVEIKPGVTVPVHQHDAFVFVYVLQGTIISRLNNQAEVEYQAGEYWLELPGESHSLTKNPSKTEKAMLLAVFVARDGARLTTSAQLTRQDK